MLSSLRYAAVILILSALSACGGARMGTSELSKNAAEITQGRGLERWRFSVYIAGGGWSQRNAAYVACTNAGRDGWTFAHFEEREGALRLVPCTVDQGWQTWLDQRLLRFAAALARERSSRGLRFTVHATDIAQPTGVYVEDPDGNCALLLPTELDAIEREEALSLKGFLRRIDEAVLGAKDEKVGISDGDPDETGRITERSASVAVRIGDPVKCDSDAARLSAELGQPIANRGDDDSSQAWLSPAPLALSAGVIRTPSTRGIDEALGELRDLWALTGSDDDEERRDAAWRIAKRFDPHTDLGFAEFVEWPLLEGLELNAARGSAWPLEVASDLLHRDPGTDEGRILYQWLSCVAAYYHRDRPAEVEALVRLPLNSPEPYRRGLNAKMLARLCGSRALPTLREVRARFGDRWHMLSLAQMLAGDREELLARYRAIPTPDAQLEGFKLCQALGLVPTRAYADAGFPGLALGDRQALARTIPALVDAGKVAAVLSSLPADGPELVAWLMQRHRTGQIAPSKQIADDLGVLRYFSDIQVEALGLLARQTSREAAVYLADLCRAGDEAARQACAKQWSPRFFPTAVVRSHVEWEMDDEAVAAADWDAVIAAAAEGRLVTFTP